MSHDRRMISDDELLRDLRGSLYCAEQDIAALQRDEPRPWRYEVSMLGHMLGAISTMAEVLSRTKPVSEPIPEPPIQQRMADEE